MLSMLRRKSGWRAGCNEKAIRQGRANTWRAFRKSRQKNWERRSERATANKDDIRLRNWQGIRLSMCLRRFRCGLRRRQMRFFRKTSVEFQLRLDQAPALVSLITMAMGRAIFSWLAARGVASAS